MSNSKTLALSNEAVPQFPVRPFLILTLLDMLEFFAYHYSLFISKYDEIGCLFRVAEWERGKQSPAKAEELDQLRHEMIVLAGEMNQAGVTIFKATLSRINEIREDCDDDPPPVVGSINRQLRRLRKDLTRDLSEQKFMSLSAEEVTYTPITCEVKNGRRNSTSRFRKLTLT